MKKIILGLILFISFSISPNAKENVIGNYTNIFNLANQTQDIKINDEIYHLKINHALSIPCSMYDEVKLEYLNDIEYVSCGYTKELK